MYCPNCGRELPINAAFCPDCGKEAPETTLNQPARILDSQNSVQRTKEKTTYTSAKAKFMEQMKIAFLLNIACDGITALYALLVPAHKFYEDSDTLKVLFLMIGLMFLGCVLLVVCIVNAAKAFNDSLNQEGISPQNIPLEDQREIKRSGEFFAAISFVIMLGSLIILFIRHAMY